jgi:hypothetical protein
VSIILGLEHDFQAMSPCEEVPCRVSANNPSLTHSRRNSPADSLWEA